MTTLKSPVTANRRGSSVVQRVAASSLMLAGMAGVLVLAGCGGMVDNAVAPASQGATLHGNLHGGQQPIGQATVTLYAAQTTATTANYNVPSVSAMHPAVTVTTDSGGNFTITHDYDCPAAPNDQMYIVAVGGDPGSGINANAVLVSALGPCSLLTSSTFITINEVSTVVAAYALSGFAKDYLTISTSPTNITGLVNAFATVNNLMDTSIGLPRNVTPAYATPLSGTTTATFNSVVPSATIYTLANTIAACVNTNGIGGTSGNCATLFSNALSSTGVMPTDTFQAALNIAKNPGKNVKALYDLATPTPPFGGALSTQPNDFTLAVNYIGGGLGGSSTVSQDAATSDLAIDAAGNVWMSNFRTSRVTELSNLGAPISASTKLTPTVTLGGYSGGGLSFPNAIAIDLSGNAWVSNGNGTVSKFTSAGQAVGTGFGGGGLGSGNVKGIAIDKNNNVWAVGSTAIAEFDNTGTAVSPTGFAADISAPTGAIALDNAGNIWVSNSGNGFVVKMKGSDLTHTTDGTFIGASSNTITSGTPFAAIGKSGAFWVPQGSPNHGLFTFNGSTEAAASVITSTSIAFPVSISVDGAGNTWTVNAGGNTGGAQPVAANITEVSDSGSILSPAATGYEGSTAAGTTLIISPKGSQVDSSGNLWVSNGINVSTVTEFIGVAAPTITPLVQAVANSAIGTLP